MPQGRKGSGSILSFAPSNSVAGPRAVPNMDAPTTQRPGRGLGAASKDWRIKGPASLFKRGGSNTSAVRSTAAPPTRDAEDPLQLVSDFARLDVNKPKQPQRQTYDPSNGPSPSMMTVASQPWSVVSHRSARSGWGPVDTDLCTLTTRTRDSFNRGDIITVPVHKTNRNPNADLTDDCLTKTKFGGVYSKRRMVVILWITYDSMFCLPLHTFSHSGLRKKPNNVKSEFVCVKNESDDDFENQGLHPPVEANCKIPLDPDSVIPLGDHVEVGIRDKIGHCGEMTSDGFIQLIALWEKVVSKAKSERRRSRGGRSGRRPMQSGLPAIMEGA